VNRKLADIFARLFDVAELSDGLSPETVEKWDSFTQLELVLELESAFGLSIPTAEAVRLNSVGGIREYLASRGAGETGSDPVSA
jgi:acyl carrier protein